MGKSKHLIWLISLSILVVILYGLFLYFVLTTFKKINSEIISLSLIGAIFVVIIFAALFKNFFDIKTKRDKVVEKLNNYFNNLFLESDNEVITFEANGNIIWVSKETEKKLGKKLIGQKIYSISPVFEENLKKRKTNFRVFINQNWYKVSVDLKNSLIVLKNVTFETKMLKLHENTRIVIGEMAIDNFQYLQTVMPHDEIFRIQTHIVNVLDKLTSSKKINLIYWQPSDGRYIFITDAQTLDILKEKNFSFLEEIRSFESKEVRLSVSIGFGTDTENKKELYEMAKEAIYQADIRGGDQVVILSSKKETYYHGSKIETEQRTSKVHIRQVAEILENKLANQDIKKVLVYGHANADLDAVGAALGVAIIAKAYKKEIYIMNETFDKTTSKVIEDVLPNEEKSFFASPSIFKKITKKQRQQTLIVVVDTAEMFRIEDPKALKSIDPKNILIFDHHRNKSILENIPPANIYIDTTSSSTAEIVTEVIGFLKMQVHVSSSVAQMLLNGIYLDTNQFQRSVSARTFIASEFLQKKGASPEKAAKIFKLTSKESQLLSKILKGLREVTQGYFLVAYDGEIPEDFIPRVAEEILRVGNRKAAFVIAKIPGKNLYKMSARGINENVQVIAEDVGGGGNFSSAAAVSEEKLEVFEENIIQSIVNRKGKIRSINESNNY